MNPAVKIQCETNSSAGRAAPAQITVAPTLRATLAESLGRMFALERGGSFKSVCLFAVSVATLSWFIDSLLPLLQEASQYLTGWLKGGAPEHHFTEPIVELVLPVIAFGATMAFLVYNAHRNARPFVDASVMPYPHPGMPYPHPGLIIQRMGDPKSRRIHLLPLEAKWTISEAS
jgi:hypothetical protein